MKCFILIVLVAISAVIAQKAQQIEQMLKSAEAQQIEQMLKSAGFDVSQLPRTDSGELDVSKLPRNAQGNIELSQLSQGGGGSNGGNVGSPEGDGGSPGGNGGSPGGNDPFASLTEQQKQQYSQMLEQQLQSQGFDISQLPRDPNGNIDFSKLPRDSNGNIEINQIVNGGSGPSGPGNGNPSPPSGGSPSGLPNDGPFAKDGSGSIPLFISQLPNNGTINLNEFPPGAITNGKLNLGPLNIAYVPGDPGQLDLNPIKRPDGSIPVLPLKLLNGTFNVRQAPYIQNGRLDLRHPPLGIPATIDISKIIEPNGDIPYAQLKPLFLNFYKNYKPGPGRPGGPGGSGGSEGPGRHGGRPRGPASFGENINANPTKIGVYQIGAIICKGNLENAGGNLVNSTEIGLDQLDDGAKYLLYQAAKILGLSKIVDKLARGANYSLKVFFSDAGNELRIFYCGIIETVIKALNGIRKGNIVGGALDAINYFAQGNAQFFGGGLGGIGDVAQTLLQGAANTLGINALPPKSKSGELEGLRRRPESYISKSMKGPKKAGGLAGLL